MSEPDNFINSNEVPPSMAVVQAMLAPVISQAIYVVAKISIADLLKDGPKSSDELAIATDTHAPTLYRLLRYLASIGIFAESDGGRFALTPKAACLLPDVPDSVRSLAIMWGEPWHWQSWGNLLYSVKTGKTAFEHVHKMEFFEYLAQNAEASKIFNGAMTNASAKVNPAIAANYDFSSIRKLVDVAGGQGSLLATILKANPTMQGVLFDVPQALEGAKQMMEAEGLGDRCELVSGSFFESVPSGGDAYILKNIIHDWDDERSVIILKNCHRAMVENGKLVLFEGVVLPDNEPSYAKFADLTMLVITPGGRERTEAEHRALFNAAGFQLTKIVPVGDWMSAIEGVRV